MEQKNMQACVLLNKKRRLCLAVVADVPEDNMHICGGTIKTVSLGNFDHHADEPYDPGLLMENFNLIIDSSMKSGYLPVWRSLSTTKEDVYAAAAKECEIYHWRNKADFKMDSQWFNNGRGTSMGKK